MDGGKETLRFATDADGRITEMEGRYGAALTFPMRENPLWQ